jgi:cysteine desulfurase / selenocysteine lyase
MVVTDVTTPTGRLIAMTARTVIDVAAARRDTPGCEGVTHLNNAGAALPPLAVTDAVVDHLRLEARIGGYEAAEAASEAIEHTYTALSSLLGCDPREVAVVENATRGWDMAFYAMPFQPGEKILTSRAEYASNVIAFLQVAQRTGAVVEVVDDDEHGQISIDDLRRRIDDRVRLIALTHVPTQGGLVNPAAAVGAVAREAGVTYLLDACQSAGQLQLDVDEIGCDVLSGTGRKYLRGPRGTGFLYVRDSLIDQLVPPFLDLHAATWTAPDRYVIRDDARRFENWETNYAGKIGLGVAVDYALALGIDAIEARVASLAETLRARLVHVGALVHDLGEQRCGIVSFSVPGQRAADVQKRLSAERINTSVSLIEYARLDLPARGLPDIVRASLHYYNTEDELEQLVAVLTACGTGGSGKG